MRNKWLIMTMAAVMCISTVACNNVNDISITEAESETTTEEIVSQFTGTKNELVIDNGIIIGYEGKETELIIPDVVIGIGYKAFYDCRSLESIIIPSSVTSIDDDAFYHCKKLSNIEIPSSVTSIGGSAFGCTQWLENRQNENPLVIVNSILVDGKKASGEVEIPNGVTCIGERSFVRCNGITSLIIPDSVTRIEEGAFIECSSLTGIEIPDSVTFIGQCAFIECSSLTGIVIPDSVTYIGQCAFYDCSDLTITCSSGSYAEQYAKENNVKYVTE